MHEQPVDIRMAQEQFSKVIGLYNEMALHAEAAKESLNAALNFKTLDMDLQARREIRNSRKKLSKIESLKDQEESILTKLRGYNMRLSH